jgi:hypothetical protein
LFDYEILNLSTLINLYLAEEVTETSNTIIHIKGTPRIFSCFNVDSNHVLAFYTFFKPTKLELFNTVKSDFAISEIIHKTIKILKSIKYIYLSFHNIKR